MNKEASVFLKHILESIQLLEKYMEGVTEEEFLNSNEKQDLAIRRLEVIGEAVRNLPEDFRKEHKDIAWSKAMATRNILIHHYFGIDLEIVWDTVIKSIPEFKKQIEQLLETTSSD
ncbi:MAG: DUF86 domain-containing protein [bacterium]|nr:DUF86 domain-containing protein [bacterium]